MDLGSLSKVGCGLFATLYQGTLVDDESVGNIVLINVAYVLNGLAANPFGGYNFNITKPDVGFETHLAGLLSELGDFGWTSIITGKSKKPLV